MRGWWLAILLLPGLARPQGAELAAASLEAVVHVYVRIEKPEGGWFKVERPSSGVVVDPSGLVLTHWSLIAEAFEDGEPRSDRSIEVQKTGGEALPATLVARAPELDLAAAFATASKIAATLSAAEPSALSAAFVKRAKTLSSWSSR